MNTTRALAAAVILVTLCQAPATAAAREGTLSWGDCPGGDGGTGMRCATLRVPVDWSKPGGRTIELKLGRLAATGSRPAEGTVLANFGAGAPGIAYLRDVPGVSAAFTRLRQSMDIVTWDPRGYTNGYSTHLPCEIKKKTLPEPPEDQAGFDMIAAGNRADAAPCHDPDPELFDSIGSVTHARDMEAIRRALGESRLNLFMGSYGGVFGQAYARLFPKRIRTMVVDGTGNMTDLEEEDEARARDSERRLRRFLAWCEDEPSCVLRGKDVPRLWQDLVARADRVPLQPGGFDGVKLQDYLGQALISQSAGPERWPAIAEATAEAIAAAARGDASKFAPLGTLVGTNPDVIACQDMPRPASYAALTAFMKRLRAVAPNTGTGGTTAVGRLRCLGYPSPVTFPSGPLPKTVPPLLGVGTWADYPATERVVRQVRGSATIYHDGPGHEIYLSGNACVTRKVNAYLVDKILPAPGTKC
ncbi:alpha/beta fold hydrolase [Nonomuraea jabiensis]|uniref:alpha/beta fold hydrolase n=1 Tax=Nonomuraea jabiensis TaxID=882448 RepID=UPI0036C677B6